MNYYERNTQVQTDTNDRDSFLPSIDFGEFLRGVLEKLVRRWMILAAFLIAGMALALFYVANATPLFTANGSILIDPRIGQTPEGDAQLVRGLLTSDALTVDSELRVITSREVTASAVRALKLDEGEAVEQSVSLGRWLSGFLKIGGETAAPDSPALTDDSREQRQLEALRKAYVRGLSVQRAGDTFVIDVTYTSPRLEFAAEAVNTLMREYLRKSNEQNIARVEQTQRWLSSRIDDLGVAVKTAEKMVADFRQENELLVPEGQMLPTEMALTAANEQMVRLRSDALSYQILAQQLTEMINAGDIEAVQVSQEERTQSLTEYEIRFADLVQQEQELLLTWDETAPSVQRIRQRKEQTHDLIIEEYRAIRDARRAQAQVLNRQVEATREVIAELRRQYGEDSGKTVELRSLEREAAAKRDLYERLLEEYNSNTQLLTFDATSARVIAWAVTPDRKSSPNSKRVVVLAVFAALVLGAGLVFLLEALESGFRWPHEITSKTGLTFLGVIPNFRSDRTKSPQNASASETTARNTDRRFNQPALRKLRFATDNPVSVTSETLRSIHARFSMHAKRVSPEGQGIVIGFTSSMRDEGKTTTAFNFATFFAQQKERVAIVDLDLISREMTRIVWPVLPKTNNLYDFINNPANAYSRMQETPTFPGLAVIGSFGEGASRRFAPRDLAEFEAMLDFLRRHFDYVFVDLPPAQGAADTQLLATLCDTLVYIVKWGATPRDQVLSALRQRGLSRDKIFGVLFTRANLRSYNSYNRHEVSDYYF